MPETEPQSLDPAIPSQVPEAPRRDFESHVRTYNGFLNLLKWFVIHIALLLVGLYFIVIADQPAAGWTFIVIAVAALVFGLLQNPKIRQDAKAAATDEATAK